MAVAMWGQVAIQATMPQEDPIKVGSLWIDTSGTATLKVCTSVSPYTFAAITGTSTNALLDGSAHTDTLAGSVVRGDLIVGNATPKWARLAVGAAGRVLKADGTDAAWGQIVNADVDAAAAIAFSKLANVSATDKLLGRSTAGAGAIEEIVCTSAARSILDDASVAAIRTTLGVGTADSPTFAGATLTGLLDVSGAAAGQVKFPAAQNASSNANTLDDYERGTWTPVVGGSGGTSGQTYSGQVGTYVKVGRLVVAQYYTALTAKGTITGTVQLQGLPFTSDATVNAYNVSVVLWVSSVTAFVFLEALQLSSSTACAIRGCTAASTTINTDLVTGDIGNTTALIGTIVYLAGS